MATTADFRNGLIIEFNNELYSIVEFQHVKPGKGAALSELGLETLKPEKSYRILLPPALKLMCKELKEDLCNICITMVQTITL